jgi:hypothetical protein
MVDLLDVEDSEDGRRELLHCAVLQANQSGALLAQQLRGQATSTDDPVPGTSLCGGDRDKAATGAISQSKGVKRVSSEFYNLGFSCASLRDMG